MTTTRIIALTGPPAAGKSTVCSLFNDLDVPTIETGEGVRAKARDRYENPTEDDMWETAEWLREEHGDAGPTIACKSLIDEHVGVEPLVVVSDLREQAEVSWLEDEYGPVLVVRVDTRSDYERAHRYVDREVGHLYDDEPIPMETGRELRKELHDREQREAPYPDHHVTLLNEDSVRMDHVLRRIQGISEFITGHE